jgi:hypothetical protein
MRMYVCMYVCMCVCMYVFMYVCVCMYVCMYECVCMYRYCESGRVRIVISGIICVCLCYVCRFMSVSVILLLYGVQRVVFLEKT